ncbi:MAG: asparagine synthase (glutamine-hydrolyzing) [Candidatus Omnitrophota bacterium]
MCGICGTFNFSKKQIDLNLLKKRVLSLRHRGPEEFGVYYNEKVALAHARLSIIDLKGGQQPIHNEIKTIWVICNGEIFNYVELREDLIKKGHKFYTKSDTEVLIHLYEEKGIDFLQGLNGQFAFALWDIKNQQMILARDRVGIRPLFYAINEGSLLFGSEIKSIFVDPKITRQIDPDGLNELFTFWATMPPRTIFKNIYELPPGHYLICKNKNINLSRYWQLNFGPDEPNISEAHYQEQLFDLIKDSIRLRLRADVPVAAYLSGGLDSSFITAIIKKYFNNQLKTFSVSFRDKNYDESNFQQQMVDFLAVDHKKVNCSYSDISKIMPQVIWHTEKPLIRTAPAPLFLLAKLVRDNGIKVVITGEGADEILAGYDLFREMKIRRFWAKEPNSKIRPQLLRKLYNHLPNWPKKTSVFLESFYRADLLKTDKLYYSHLPRWSTTQWITNLFSDSLKEQLKVHDVYSGFLPNLPAGFSVWDDLSKAQYIEMITLLSGNLLSSQGDRMMMAHSVEGRMPFLDYRVIEFCAKIPPRLRLKVFQEKYILKQIASPLIPQAITQRIKQGYRAPDAASFFGEKTPAYIEDLLCEENLHKTGYFSPKAVEALVNKCKVIDISKLSARQNMAIVGVITTLLVEKLFIRDFKTEIDKNTFDNIKIIN